MSDVLTGFELEDWLRRVADEEGIAANDIYNMQKFVKQLHIKLPTRLDGCKLFLDKDYPDGIAWIESIIFNNQEPRIANITKQEFCLCLLDRVMAIDTIVELPDSQGNPVRLAIDLTSANEKESSKVQKIRGAPHPRDRQGENRNANIPRVRKDFLNVQKHVVVVVDNIEALLPNNETLVKGLQNFIESPSITGSVFLNNLDYEQTVGYSQFIGNRERFFKDYVKQAVAILIYKMEPVGKVTTTDENVKYFEGSTILWGIEDNGDLRLIRKTNNETISAKNATKNEIEAMKKFVSTVQEKYGIEIKPRQNNQNPQYRSNKPRL